MNQKSKKPIPCVMCKTNLYSWDECSELWINGHRIWICKCSECRKELARKIKERKINPNELL